jgi:hypothetical protein
MVKGHLPCSSLVAAQSLERRAPKDSRSLWRLMVAIENKQRCLITK